VYILRCAGGSLYVGHTSDIAARVIAHNEGRGAQWTACRLPVTLVYSQPHASELRAITRERPIKRWSHDKKFALINGGFKRLKSLGGRRIR
jgi:predicted GIY-YIG superfamily endonuclease